MTPASGALYLSFAYGDGTEILTAGQVLDVEPGSAIEAAIGVTNLTPLNAAQLAENANGGGGFVSN